MFNVLSISVILVEHLAVWKELFMQNELFNCMVQL